MEDTLQQYIEHAQLHLDHHPDEQTASYFNGQLEAFKLILEGKISDVVYEGRRDWD